MRQILGMRKIDMIHTKYKTGTESNRYRIVIPNVVLEKLNLSCNDYIAFEKKNGDVHLTKEINILTRAICRFNGLDIRKIRSKNRVYLSSEIVSFLRIKDGDYLVFIESKKGNIRLHRLRKMKMQRGE